MSIPGADPGPWLAAERALARPLADLAAGLARLGARIEAEGPAAPGRLAAGEAVALARSFGARLSLERFELWRHDGPAGRAAPRDLARAGWAARRLAAATPPRAALTDPEALRGFLGLEGARTDAGLAPLLARETGPGWAEAAGGFCAAMAGLGALHPIARAAAALALWRALAPGGPLEGAVLAARLAAEPSGPGAAAMAGPGFLPLGAWPGTRAGAAEGDRLAALLEAGLARLPGILAGLARRAEWRARAEAGCPPGRVARAALPILGAQALVSANMLRDRLGVSQQAANAALMRLQAAGLVVEVSRQRRYRVWRARV